ncbi:urease accessory protein UreD [Rhodobacteraceae bacterium CYK-10]|uniref:Urease accessory protein UreD n=2 Tax=Stagnihabitans tardus TaxID=2699202 RepID=A0AAE5BVQ4_9RHOB|nr:urease accessory protein UreD [Stagnihabitans tardus]
MQRAKGRAHAAFALKGGTRLADLRQQGSAKVLLPRVAGDRPELVFLNTSGGLTGGDLLELSLDLAPGTKLSATTQTAERAYQSPGPAAQVCFRARVQAASLHWLPQETILFQDSHLTRSTEIDLSGEAEVLLCESLVLGRHAMGETLTRARLTDSRMIRRDGVPVWAEGQMLSPETLSRPVLLGGATAFGVLALVARGAEDIPRPPQTEGARLELSAWDGRALIRIAASSGFALRRQMAAVITQLSGRALPRVWASGGTP